jgi:hypothetical protein
VEFRKVRSGCKSDLRCNCEGGVSSRRLGADTGRKYLCKRVVLENDVRNEVYRVDVRRRYTR